MPLVDQADRTAVSPRHALRIEMLGDFRVSCGNLEVPVDAWHLRNAERLVKLLALAPGQCLHREAILDHLWPQLDLNSAANNLRYTVHVARRVLSSVIAGDVIVRRGDRLSLDPSTGVEVDVVQFESWAAAARRSGDLVGYRKAIDLYRGELLPGDHYDDWTVPRRETLRSTYLSLLIEYAGMCQSSGDSRAAVSLLQQVVALDPAHEEAHFRLMHLYAGLGQRQQALRQYRLLQEALQEELDVDPDPASQRLYQQILTWQIGESAEDDPRDTQEEPDVPTRPENHNLSIPLTSFIGREREVAQLFELLKSSRLITLTGAGGIGKTRLALELARRLMNEFDDGVWMVDLANLADPDILPRIIAAELGIPEQRKQDPLENLVAGISDRKLLLVLDNCEHLADACYQLLMKLLGACANVQVLATSRARLKVAGERIWSVPPLGAPDSGLPQSFEEIRTIESVQLFVERAAFVRPDFALNESNADALSRICRRLDGLPLAIELAAARIAVLTPEQLAARLDQSQRLLTGANPSSLHRHQTMRATIDWSYALLSPSGRQVLQWMSVFSGGWTLDAAEAIVSPEDIEGRDPLDALGELVDQSFVVVEERGNQARYRLLEPIRQYASELLRATGDANQVHQRHIIHFLSLVELPKAELSGPIRTGLSPLFENELENFRAALRWALDSGNVEHGMRLGAALGDYWFINGRQGEGRSWLSALLAHPGSSSSELLPLRGQVIVASFILAYRQGDYASAMELAEESRALHQNLGDRRGVAWALSSLAMATGELGDLPRSEELLEESLTLSRELNDTYSVARALDTLGELNRFRGDYSRARDLYTESLALFRHLDATAHIAIVLHNLGQSALALGDPLEATARFQESLVFYRELDHPHGKIFCLAGLAGAACALGHASQAARLLGTVHALRNAHGLTSDAADRVQQKQYLDSLRATLGVESFQIAWEAGCDQPLDVAIAEALALSATEPEDVLPLLDSLSIREREVAERISNGLTNRQIAAELGIAKRTVDTHVSHILRKLGFTSRSELSSWITQLVNTAQ